MPEQTTPPEFDPAAFAADKLQHNADFRIAMENLVNARMELATLKVLYYLARASIPNVVKGHPNQIKADIDDKVKLVDALQAIVEDLGEDGVIPLPSPLAIASAAP
jgi:hypothetical protein